MDIRNIKAYIYWDFDDVLGKTHAQMLYLLKYIFGYVADPTTFLSPDNTGGRMKEILDSAGFMRNTAFDYPALNCMRALREWFPNLEHGLATHRGYHKDGERNTMYLLNEYEVKFDSYHFIDPAQHRDKMGYLRSLHQPDDLIILVDDNPFYDHDKYPNSWTVLVDKPWNKHVVTTDPDLRVKTSGIFTAVEMVLRDLRLEAPADERAA